MNDNTISHLVTVRLRGTIEYRVNFIWTWSDRCSNNSSSSSSRNANSPFCGISRAMNVSARTNNITRRRVSLWWNATSPPRATSTNPLLLVHPHIVAELAKRSFLVIGHWQWPRVDCLSIKYSSSDSVNVRPAIAGIGFVQYKVMW